MPRARQYRHPNPSLNLHPCSQPQSPSYSPSSSTSAQPSHLCTSSGLPREVRRRVGREDRGADKPEAVDLWQRDLHAAQGGRQVSLPWTLVTILPGMCSCPCTTLAEGNLGVLLGISSLSPHQVAEEERQQRKGRGRVSEQRQQGGHCVSYRQPGCSHPPPPLRLGLPALGLGLRLGVTPTPALDNQAAVTLRLQAEHACNPMPPGRNPVPPG